MKERIYIQNRSALIKLGALLLSTLLFASSCGSSNSESNPDDLSSPQLAESEDLVVEETGPTSTTTSVSQTVTTTAQVVTTTTQSAAASSTFNEQELEALTANYLWMESSEAVESLQEILDLAADGIYGSQTRRAHHSLLIEEMLPTSGIPDCGPMIKSDRSFMQIPIGTSKSETVELIAATCGEGMAQPGARGATWQQPEGVNGPAISWETLRVGSPSGEKYWVRVVFAEATTEGTGSITDEDWLVGWSYVNGLKGNPSAGTSATSNLAYEIQPEGALFPRGVELGMTTEETLERLDLSNEDLQIGTYARPGDASGCWDQMILWGSSPNWSEGVYLEPLGISGTVMNESYLFFDDGALAGWSVMVNGFPECDGLGDH